MLLYVENEKFLFKLSWESILFKRTLTCLNKDMMHYCSNFLIKGKNVKNESQSNDERAKEQSPTKKKNTKGKRRDGDVYDEGDKD